VVGRMSRKARAVWIVWTSAANASVVCGRGEDVERGKRVGRSSRIWSTQVGLAFLLG
jgi:hypothetical protein